MSQAASNDSLNQLAEVRRQIAGLIANDKAMSAADAARDKMRFHVIEERHRILFREFKQFAKRVNSKPPRTRLDIVIRAEIAGHMLVDDKPRTDWKGLLEETDDFGADLGMSELVSAVLFLEASEGGEAPA